MDALSPNLFVRDIRATLAFYRVLGFTLTMSVPDEAEGEPVWAMVTNGKVSFMFQTFQSLGDTLPQISRTDGGSLLFYINVQEIASFFDSVKDKVQVLHGLQKTFYGATEFSILDNNNFVLTFAKHEQS